MKSIGTRLAFWNAVVFAVALGCLFLAGRKLLENHALRTLDMLNASEFEQIKAALGTDPLPAESIRQRMGDQLRRNAVFFFVEIHQHDGAVVYRSENFAGHTLPDLPDSRVYSAIVGELGRLRVGNYRLGSMHVLIAVSKDQVREIILGYERVFYLLFAAMFVLTIVGGRILTWLALRPVRAIQEAATHISSHNLGERIPVSRANDEISNLAHLLNEMFDRLEAAFHQTRRFTAEVSHELKTPLSIIRLNAEKLLLEGKLGSAEQENVQLQLEAITQLNYLINELLFLSRAEAQAITLQAQPLDPQPFLEGFAADARVLAESHGMHFELQFHGAGQAAFNPKWIRQVLLNLVMNAYRASPPDGTVTLKSELSEKSWRVTVSDQGHGVPVDQLEKIFERFVRVGPKDEADGNGLGLPISRSLIKLHGGTISARPAKSGEGLEVAFEIPVEQPPSS
ncbi:MAG: cusS [Verrucomicrobia bacterium]|nr:cusS [Verrucomicrobiota bacterium]